MKLNTKQGSKAMDAESKEVLTTAMTLSCSFRCAFANTFYCLQPLRISFNQCECTDVPHWVSKLLLLSSSFRRVFLCIIISRVLLFAYPNPIFPPFSCCQLATKDAEEAERRYSSQNRIISELKDKNGQATNEIRAYK